VLVVAALVRLTSAGPVLYRQQRIGQMMRPFEMLKFRTMAFNAAHGLHQDFVTTFIAGGDGEKTADPNRVFKIVKDPRITSIGHFLRRTSIDELPQLWNVLRGDMSLVGPRPPLAYEVAHYKAWHLRRIAGAKPGVTGLWQVKGRSRTTFDEMVRLDLRYVRRRSLWTDLRILLATPRAVISGKGAC
jgi:lipopolysaccharide/colanic/teichoic acid biosynthesis glycosyltransferase